MPLPFHRPILSALTALTVVAPAIAIADTTTESQFISDTNSARSQNGLRQYAVASDLTSIARHWAQHMARYQTLEHNPSYSSEMCCWQSAGENVGAGPDEPSIQQAFMSSQEHRDNILSRSFTQIGVGTARDSQGRLYVDELFRQPDGSAPAVAAPVTVAAPPARSRTETRVSRAAVRHPRVPSAATIRARAAAAARQLLATRLAAARRAASPAVDPVGGAVAFVRLMRMLTAPAG